MISPFSKAFRDTPFLIFLILLLFADGELMMTILASYAQEESLSASENQKWRVRKAFENGEIINLRFLFGYDITPDGIRVNETDAAIVREIFARFNGGESMSSICRDLDARGHKGVLGGTWCAERMRNTLSNEKYLGNALLQKQYRNNHIEKKLLPNRGELPMYYAEGTHEPIIDQATFDKAQERLRILAQQTSNRKKPTHSAFFLRGDRKWRPDCWPEGPKRWLDACKREGIKPGLWFSTNLLRIGGEANTMKIIPEWESSVAEDGTTLCLFRGGYLHHLMQTLQMYADMGIKMFKFDFAYFDAATPDAKCTMLPTDIEEQNKNAFISAIKEFRYRNPDVLFIGYNGFGGDMENTVTPFRKTVDLRWLEIFDTMYCGDPRLSDVPMMNFWRSQDLYSDHMTFQYLFNGVPVRRIDNCAFMIGTTGTCYNRALNAWKGMMILTMARGGWLNVCHGNIDLLSDDDARWMAKVQQLYMKVQQYVTERSTGHI